MKIKMKYTTVTEVKVPKEYEYYFKKDPYDWTHEEWRINTNLMGSPLKSILKANKIDFVDDGRVTWVE